MTYILFMSFCEREMGSEIDDSEEEVNTKSHTPLNPLSRGE
jgi:hypothetical protein